jgi:HAD superfamily hydrolase (TIGR01509 family)
MERMAGPDSEGGGPIDKASLKAVVFDCDGVIFDSREANVRYYDHILKTMGLPPVRRDQVEFVHMHASDESLRELVGEGPALEEALRLCRTLDYSPFKDGLECEPGLAPLLEGLRPSYRIGMATNRGASTHSLLEHFNIHMHFDLVVTTVDVQHPKPHPESMERIMEAFGTAPEEILYIGDTKVDEDLALATGVYFTAYKNPDLKAHLHIGHFDELSRILL